MFEDIQIITWPDPRLLKTSQPIDKFDESLRALVDRMFVLMRESKGVGLAAPQVGRNIRLFVMNPTGKPEDDRVCINPVLSDPEDSEESEEGCLSLPGITINVLRAKTITLTALDIEGKPSHQREIGYLARIWQHEIDHLDGILLTDRMGPLARLGNRKKLKELEENFAESTPPTRKK